MSTIPPKASEFFNKCRRSILPTPLAEFMFVSLGASLLNGARQARGRFSLCAMQQKQCWDCDDMGLSGLIFLNRLREAKGNIGWAR